MLQVWLGLPILERKRTVCFNSSPPLHPHRTPSSQPRSKRELDFKFVSGRSMERLEVEFEAYAQSHSYDSPLVSQPSMSSSSSSSQLRLTLGLLTPSLDFSDVEPVTRPWKDVYSERSTVERSWRRGRYSVRTLRGHTDGVTCIQFREALQHPSFPTFITYVCGTLRLASRCAACADICVLCGRYSSTRPS
jgi:F-box/WD-40 domain protein MET30